MTVPVTAPVAVQLHRDTLLQLDGWLEAYWPASGATVFLVRVAHLLTDAISAGGPLELSRDDALRLAGWIGAHRPSGDWEPMFVGQAVIALNRATAGPGDDDDHDA